MAVMSRWQRAENEAVERWVASAAVRLLLLAHYGLCEL